MTSLEDFDRQLKAALVKNKPLSSSTIQRCLDLAMLSIPSDAQLVASLFKRHKQAPTASKLYSLYLIDAIAREARSRAKKKVKGTPDGAGEGTCSSFLTKLEAVLSKLIVDCWENGLQEHREKVRKVLGIWSKGSTFSSSALNRIDSKLAALDDGKDSTGPTVSASVASVAAGSTTPTDAPPAPVAIGGLVNGLPASVAALLAASKPSSAASTPAPSVESEVERAVAAARAGVARVPSPTPQPPPPSSLNLLAGFDPALLDPARLASLQQALSGVGVGAGVAEVPPTTTTTSYAPPPQQGGYGYLAQGQGQRQEYGGGGGEWGQPREEQGQRWRDDDGWGRADRERGGGERGGRGGGWNAEQGGGGSVNWSGGGGYGQQGQYGQQRQENNYDRPQGGGGYDAPPQPVEDPRLARRRPRSPSLPHAPLVEVEQPPRKKRWDAPPPSAPPVNPPRPPVAAAKSSPPPEPRAPLPTRPSPPPPLPTSAPSLPPPTQQPTLAGFDPTSPASWSAMAPMLAQMNGGVMPSTEMVCAWFAGQMMMMQGGGMGGQGMGMGMGGPGQGGVKGEEE